MPRRIQHKERTKSWTTWALNHVANSCIVVGLLAILVLSLVSLANNAAAIDHYLSGLSPYAGVRDLHITSDGFKSRIPKPIFCQVYRDVYPFVDRLGREIGALILQIRGSLTGQQSYLEPQEIGQKPVYAQKRSNSSSLLFVSTFCKQMFRDLSLEECKRQVEDACGIDILTWFNHPPNQKQVEQCVVGKFYKETGFFKKLTEIIDAKERVVLPSKPRPKVWTRLVLLGGLLGVLAALVAAVQFIYRKLLYDNPTAKLRLKKKEVSARVESNTVALAEKHWQTEQDTSTECLDFNSVDCSVCLEHSLYGFCTLIVLDPRPINQWDAELEVAGVHLDIVPDHGQVQESLVPRLLLSPLYIDEVCVSEEQSGEVLAAEPPALEYLDISWQKSMLEEARVGITTIHQADFDFDLEGSGEGATEDNIFVTGLEQDKDDPLKFNYWRKRLRDVRADLSKAALATLKAKCPTLFMMGWFEDGQKTETTPDDGIPSKEIVLEIELDSEIAREEGQENNAKVRPDRSEDEGSEDEGKDDAVPVPKVLRERQLSNDTFQVIE